MTKSVIITIIILLTSITGISANSSIEGLQRFTKEHPMKVLCDWNYPPYEYIDDNGQAAGFNIEVTDRILSILAIPHKFIMQESEKQVKMYNHQDFDLAIDAKRSGFGERLYFGNIPLGYYRICILHLRNNKITNKDKDITNKLLYTQKGDISEYVFRKKFTSLHLKETNDIHLAMRAVMLGKADGIIWVKEPSKWLIHKYGMKDLVLSELNLPIQAMFFVSKDNKIVNIMDEQLAHMQQNGEVDFLHAKWFKHQTYKKDNSAIVSLGILILSMCIVISLVFIHIQRNKIKEAKKHAKNLFRMRALALKMDRSNILIINPDEIYANNKSWSIKRIHPDNNEFINRLHEIALGKRETLEEVIKYNISYTTKPQWEYYRITAIAEKRKSNKISKIVMTWKDITNEITERIQYKEMSDKYIAILNSALIGLSFYDKDGFLINSNKQMCRIFKIKNLEGYIGKYNIFEGEIGNLLKDKDNNILPLYASSNIVIKEKGLDIYVELQIEPVKDNEGNTIYIIAAIKDISYERYIYISLTENANKYKKAEIRMKTYSDMLRNILDMSNTRIWIYDLKEQTIKYSKNLKQYEKSITLEEYIGKLSDNNKTEITKILNQEDRDKPKSINIIQHFKQCFNKDDIWLAINGVPIYNSDGVISEYRGTMHDVTELMQTQDRLKIETDNAERSEKMKSMFLANMSHEIRTPLNSIVGFSDLLDGLEKKDRNDFLHIINNNCDMLLRLINDILELSEMDSNTQTLSPSDVDWAVAFNDICTSLKQRVKNPKVNYIIENPFKKMSLHIDAGRLNQVITNFVTNAIKYTKSGYIKVGYKYINNGLHIYCEDTGSGIPDDKREKIFERFVKLNDFVQGTGLGLSICKTIAERYNGKIGVDSTVGKGSIFWIWIPCNYAKKE
ncbi:MAG: transporter substrate-binding domain-containing protein [Prevotella sp.]|nr:transporter substrate-binding domain-containing protein [Prevotella sp.]